MSRLVRFLATLSALGAANNDGGSARWRYHSVSLRDDGENDKHSAAGNWQGIVAVVRSAMVSRAI